MRWDCQNIYDRLYSSWSRGALGHAYLLTGDPEKVRTRIFLPFLKTLNPAAPHHVHELFPTSEAGLIGVEAVRSFMQDMEHPAHEGNWRVGLLPESHRLTAAAASSLLKPLEEPGERRIFFLLAPRREEVFSTIVSRCQYLPVRDARWEEPAWLKVILDNHIVESPFAAWSLALVLTCELQTRKMKTTSKENEGFSGMLGARAADRDWLDTLKALASRWPTLALACDSAKDARRSIHPPATILGNIILTLTTP